MRLGSLLVDSQCGMGMNDLPIPFQQFCIGTGWFEIIALLEGCALKYG